MAINMSNDNQLTIDITFQHPDVKADPDLFEKLGASRDHMIMVDSKGVIYKGRKQGMNP